MKKLKFNELALSDEVLKAIEDMGFEEASPIQSEAIPYLLKKRDIIGQAQTGTGKTAAFGIPVIENINPDSKNIQAVILCPTRELVIQVADELKKIAKYKEKISLVAIYGGQQIERQFKALKKFPQIVVGTPGRVMDHMRRGTIKFDFVKTIVLDEADEMLDMGFREDIELILEKMPENRQTVMFSATMAKEIIKLTKQYQTNPEIINIQHKKLHAPNIQQFYFEIPEKTKFEALSRLIDLHNIKLGVVFCNTKKQVDELVENLKIRGYFADKLHGDMNQTMRDKVMGSFRRGAIEILVATDVAGRGIDVNNVEAVFNYDLPRDDEDYVHRIGRTGRAGKSGMAFTFVVGRQVYNLKRIEKLNEMKIVKQQIPSIVDIQATKICSFMEKVKNIVVEGHLGAYKNHVESLMGEDYTSLDIAAALIKLAVQDENKNFDSSCDFSIPQEKNYSEKKQPKSNKKSSNIRGYQARKNNTKKQGDTSRQNKNKNKSYAKNKI